MEDFKFLFFYDDRRQQNIQLYTTRCWCWLPIVVHNSHPIAGKAEKFRNFRTSLPPAHLLSIGAIIERLYIYEE